MGEFVSRCTSVLPMLAFVLCCSVSNATELNPAAVTFVLPDKVEWKRAPGAGNESAVLVGDPTKEGLYVVLYKWLKGNNFSRPHFHPNDRFITVIKDTWWVETGNKFDPDNTVAMPAHCRDPLRQAGALGRREGRGCGAADRRHGTGDKHAGRRSEVTWNVLRDRGASA